VTPKDIQFYNRKNERKRDRPIPQWATVKRKYVSTPCFVLASQTNFYQIYISKMSLTTKSTTADIGLFIYDINESKHPKPETALNTEGYIDKI